MVSIVLMWSSVGAVLPFTLDNNYCTVAGIRKRSINPKLAIFVRLCLCIPRIDTVGHGHNISGVKGTQPGELAVLCPACPHPGINLPSNWESRPSVDQFLYCLHLATDANFHLKNRSKPGGHSDPGLSTGWAYFVEDKIYKKFLLDFVPEKDISTCSGLAALDLANTRKLGDLQKGKCYSNMDFIIFSSLRLSGLHSMLLSYDIFCQWIKKQAVHHAQLPPLLCLNSKTQLTGVILKFHLPVHKQQCHTKFSLNLCPGAGRMDGEGIERDWANINPATNSTKEMGKGSRHDTIDDLFRDWNYFQCRLFECVTDEWLAMVLAWELDNTKPDLYIIMASSMTQAQIRLELVQSERQSHAVGKPELHANWKNTNVAVQSGPGTALQQTDIQEHQLQVEKHISAFCMIQSAYMPEAMCLVAAMPSRDDSDCHPETQLLRLPSQLPSSTRASNPCLADMERKLCYAQATDSIAELCQSLIVCAHLTKYKVDQVSGQNPNTCARTLLNKAEAQMNRIAMRYSVARKSYLTLAGSGKWESVLKPLGKDNLHMHEALCVEWAKACARMQCWAEEVQLLQEEMRCVLQFSEYCAAWWEDWKSLHMPRLLLNLSDGIHAYAAKQASILHDRAKDFAQIWKTPGVDIIHSNKD
ncbi:hypothetical protein BS47DRAFT_1366595 [Hydnum rufescens UP504]|uniref:CxC2-like cysteine cluster KDZ transposase-associated domain-containing protein n=1 Tax=Hydnum rufescens UP504 TaxID=1448309 RepID=A0A9P6AKQ6_9AGAM|nr:hypothetical protein BS47DRAFT_1366595 [Hydnum rufescens UP504]